MTNEAHRVVEQMLRDAVETAKSPEEFQSNLQLAQSIGQRMLAVLIFNAAQNDAKVIDQLFEKVGLGIKQELHQIVEAAKDKNNLSSVDVEFGKTREH